MQGNLKDSLNVVIIKMKESSGNEQFFVQLRHKDCKGIFDVNKVLDYDCHQTMVQRNVVRTIQECLQCAWFSASILSTFINSSKEDIKILGLSEEEIDYLKQQSWD